jgi:uncharacterized protein
MAADSSSPGTVAKKHGHPRRARPHFRHHPLYRKTLHFMRTMHTYLTMLALILFLFFAVTGFMLNHEEWFGLDNSWSSTSEAAIPPSLLSARDKLALVEYLRANCSVGGAVEPFDWPSVEDPQEPLHLAFKSPRGQTDIDIALSDGKAAIAVETNGVGALLMNLHRAKHAGPAWRLVTDATALLVLLASVSGFVLWYSLPKRRTLGLIGLVASVVMVCVFYFALVP